MNGTVQKCQDIWENFHVLTNNKIMYEEEYKRLNCPGKSKNQCAIIKLFINNIDELIKEAEPNFKKCYF